MEYRNSAALQSTVTVKAKVYTSDPSLRCESCPKSIGEATSVITVVQSISATVTLTPNPAQAQKGQLIDLTASVQDPPTKTLYYEWTVNGVKWTSWCESYLYIWSDLIALPSKVQ